MLSPVFGSMIVYQPGTFWKPRAEQPDPEPAPNPEIAPDAAWWLGKKLICGFCTCVFGVVPGDTLTTDCLPYLFAARPEGRPAQLRLSVLCPECRMMNRFCESDAEDLDPFEPIDAAEELGL